jgi:superfamily II DNA or RNA helicase
MPVSWKATLIQYAGRLHRLHARDTEAAAASGDRPGLLLLLLRLRALA